MKLSECPDCLKIQPSNTWHGNSARDASVPAAIPGVGFSWPCPVSLPGLFLQGGQLYLQSCCHGAVLLQRLIGRFVLHLQHAQFLGKDTHGNSLSQR